MSPHVTACTTQVQQNDRGAHLALSPLEWELQTVHAPSSQVRGTGIRIGTSALHPVGLPIGTSALRPLGTSSLHSSPRIVSAHASSHRSSHLRASSPCWHSHYPRTSSAPPPQARIAAALPLRRAQHVSGTCPTVCHHCASRALAPLARACASFCVGLRSASEPPRKPCGGLRRLRQWAAAALQSAGGQGSSLLGRRSRSRSCRGPHPSG